MAPPKGRQCPMLISHASSFQQLRRDAALERQRKSREAKLAECRAMDCDADPDGHLSMVTDSCHIIDEVSLSKQMEENLVMGESSNNSKRNSGPSSRILVHRREFMHPEWMTEVPPDIQENWLVAPRPEGVRCLVTTTGDHTVSRKKTGTVLHHFNSELPGGSKSTRLSSDQSCVLDCIFQEQNEVYYVMDLLCWRGMSLMECTAEFRFYWAEGKVKESNVTDNPSARHKYRFDLVTHKPCTIQGLKEAIRGSVNYQQDGIIVAHKNGMYVPGSTPLMMLWKDASCSRFFLETDGDGNLPRHQVVTLAYDGCGGVATEDEPPVSFGKIVDCGANIEKSSLKKGKLMKFAVNSQGHNISQNDLQGINLGFLGFGNQRKGRADTISKILFQYYARLGRISLDSLITAIGHTGNNQADNGNQEAYMDRMQ